ncbi:amino acid adenylation domain-containing protein [Lysobacter tyrosinilyticus]
MFLFELVQYFEQHGIGVEVDNGKLRVTGDQSKLTAEVTDAIRRYKGELTAQVARESGRIIPQGGSNSYPLSYAQQRLYFLYQYDPSVTSFILPLELELKGALDAEAFRRAIVTAVHRHAIYRTTYFTEGGVARQRVESDRTFEVEWLDMSGQAEAERAAMLARKRDEISQRPFDLQRDLPLRVCLVRQGEDSHRLMVGIHHIATDEWSIQQFVREVSEAYRNGSTNNEAPALSYPDYAAWQVAQYEQGGYEVSRSYWKTNLDGIKGVLELPLDAPRPAIQSFNGATVRRRLSAVAESVAAASRQMRISEFTFYLGVFNVLTSKLTGDRDIVVGTDVFGRDHADLEAMAGFFVNQVALRSQVDPEQSIAEYMAHLGESTLASLRYQDMPFDKVVEALNIERDTAYSPVFQVKFLYDRTPHGIDLFDSIDVSEGHVFPTRSQYDITLKIEGEDAVFYFNTDLFKTETIERWADLYLSLTSKAIEDTQVPISTVLQDELKVQLAQYTQGEEQEVRAGEMFAQIDRAAKSTPDAIAVRTGDAQISYADLNDRVGQIATRLMSLGVKKGDKVAVYLERSIAMVAAIVAVMRCGAVFVPLDSSYPREHIDYTLSDSEATIVISDSSLSETLSEFYGFVLDIESIPAKSGAEQPSYPAVDGSDLAYLLYTSGSTGRPKGALISHAAFSNLCDWYVRFCGLNASSNVLLMIPIGFDASIKNILCPLMVGGTVVLAKPGMFDPDGLLQLIAQAGVSLINCAPSAFNALVKTDASNDYQRLSSLSLLALGGEALDVSALKPWLTSANCRAELANIYGPTECTDISVAHKARGAQWLQREQVVIGRPIQNAQAYIVDANLALCPPGVAGELLIAGRGVGSGYHNLSDATARSFVSTTLSDGPAYRTGDICRYDSEGQIVYQGRRDGQIKIRGKRVEINEIVAQLAQCLPSRKISVQLYTAGELEMLVAFADGGAGGMSADDIKRQLTLRLPRHMVPAQILFVDQLPLTPNGKVDAKSLIATFEAQRALSVSEGDVLDEVEQAIANIWGQLLSVDGLQKTSDFFSLGGDSIFSIQLVAELRNQGMNVSVADIFKYPTIEQLAEYVRGGGCVVSAATDEAAERRPFALVPQGDRALLSAGLEDAYPVTTLQHGMIFHGLMDEEASAYHDVFSFELTFDYDEASFLQALEKVVALHPVLRTGFDLGTYSVPLQLVYAQVAPNVEIADIRMHDAERQDVLVAEHIRRLKDQGFDIKAHTLIRFSILRKAENCIQFVIDAHHAILDGWSMATLQRQVFDYYLQIKAGQTVVDRYDPGQARFAEYVAQVLQDERSQESRMFWTEYCKSSVNGAISQVWPTSQAIENREIRLDLALGQQLDGVVAREGIPVKTLMLMAHAYMLSALTGESRMVTGNADNGRLEALGAENVLGLFLNALPYNLDVGNTTWRDLGHALLQSEGDRKPHRRYPFSTILRENPNVVIDSLFTYTNFRISRELTRDESLKVKIGELFEELNFKVSTHVSGNRDDGYSLLLRSKIHLSDDYMDLLLGRYIDALKAMVADFGAVVPAPHSGWMPLVTDNSGMPLFAHVRHAGLLDGPALVEAAKELASRAVGEASRSVDFEPIELKQVQIAADASDAQCEQAALAAIAGMKGLFRIAHFVRADGQHLILSSEPAEAKLGHLSVGRLLARYQSLRSGSDALWVRLERGGEWIDAGRIEQSVAFWSQHLGAAPIAFALPLEHARPAALDVAKTRLPLQLPKALVSGLEALAQRNESSPDDVLLAAWVSLLSRLSGQAEVVIGTRSADGKHLLPLRIDVAADPSIPVLLRQINATKRATGAHLALPLSQLRAALYPEVAGAEQWIHSAILAEDGSESSDVTQVALTLLCGSDGLPSALAFATEVLDQGTVERFAHQLSVLLASIVAEESCAVGRLNLLPLEEREQVLIGFNSNRTNDAHDRTIHSLFEAQVAAHPDAEALRYEGASLSYAELNRRANQVAHKLLALGVQPDERVAVCTERSLAMIVGVLGVLKAGAAYVPVDPSYPSDRIAYMLSDSRPKAVLTQAALVPTLPGSDAPVLVIDGNALEGEASDNPSVAGLTSRHLAYVIYTSGSTGQPKGVMVEHRSAVNFWRVMGQTTHRELAPHSRVALNAAFSFDMSLKGILQLLSGHCLVLIPQELRANGPAMVSFLEAERIAALDSTPSQLEVLLSAGLLEPTGPRPVSVYLGGEPVGRVLWERLKTSPVIHFHNMYGPTECTVDATIGSIRESAGGPVIGRPIANTPVYVLDTHGEPVPVGVAGELFLGGVQVARGYLDRPELTAERFVRDPFSNVPDARMYKTGDLGRWLPDGTLEYLGRNDFQVKIRGFRIELGEIEARLRECNGVREAAVLAREDNGSEKRLVAYVVAEDTNTTLSVSELREQLSRELAEFMVPSAFVQLEKLPLTPNGKLDRKALPAPDQSAVASRAYEAPVGEVEQVLAGIWQELLGLERVGRHDHFFELGGHSLIAVQLVTRVRELMGLELGLRDVFARATLQDMAGALVDSDAVAMPPIVPVDRNSDLPLSFAQQRLWMLDQLDHAAGSAYHMPLTLKMTGALDRAALQTALDRIVARHESLRTRFESVNGVPLQRVSEQGTFSLVDYDLRNLDAAAQKTAIDEHSITEAHELFDLSTGPMIRGRLLRLSEQEHVLLVTQHHIISDGWSHGVLLREVKALYTAFSQGQPDPLPELAIQYADYATWQRQWLQGEVIEGQVDYWREHLSGAPALLELPTDRPRPPVQSYSGDRIDVNLSAALTTGLRELSKRHGTTMFMTLLAGWSTLLSRLSGQGEVVVGTPVANRQHSETEPLIGFFLNTLALRVGLNANLTVAELLEQIKSTTLGGYAHQDLPFEQVVEALQPTRSLSHNLLFQAMLTLDNTPRGGSLSLPGVEMTQLDLLYYKAHFDLGLFFADEGQAELSGELEFATDLFDRSTIERMLQQLITLLESMVADDTQKVGDLPLMSAAGREQVLVEFNRTDVPYSADRLAHSWFEEQARRAPDATALLHEGRAWSFAEINDWANRIAHRLIAQGVAPDDRVALCARRSPEMVAGLLGVLKAGGAYVPLEPSYPQERLAYMLDDSAPVALLVQSELRGMIPDTFAVPVLAIDEARTQDVPATNPTVAGLASHNAAYVIYTSGSTGRPKGVLVAHRNLANYLEHASREYLDEEIAGALVATPLGFDATLTTLMVPWISGKPVVLLPEDTHECLKQLLVYTRHAERWLFKLTPAHLDALANLADEGAVDTRHVLVVGGEQLTTRGLKKFRERVLPNAVVINEYGPTETVVGCTTYVSDGSESLAGEAVPIGRPLSNTRIYLLDSRGEPVPVGVPGEIHIGGVQVAPGYLHRPELTHERFVTDVFGSKPDGRLYRTGDLARWLPDGNLEYLGRNDFQVKIRGYRIELGEIEARIVDCDGIREAVVVAREYDNGDKRLVAYFVPEEGAEPAVAALRDTLSQMLAEYMVPSAFVRLEALPLTQNGKIDRHALPSPEMATTDTAGFQAPVGEIETIVAEIWQGLFGVERVGRTDNFFQLGGHSLLAISLIERLRQRDLKADVGMLFTAPTLSGFAAQLAKPVAPEWEVPANLIPEAFGETEGETDMEEISL